MSLIATMRAKAEERKNVLDAANAILTKAENGQRDLTTEERQEFDRRHADGEKLLDQINVYKKQIEANASLDERQNDGRQAGREDRGKRQSELSDDDKKRLIESRNIAMQKYLMRGDRGLTQEDRDALENLADFESRSLVVGTADQGGHTVPENTSFYAKIVEAMLDTGLDESNFTVLNTDDGRVLPIPTVNDTGNESVTHTEMEEHEDADDPDFDKVDLNAFGHTSEVLKVSNELLRDSAVMVESLIARMIGQRIARTKAALLTTGDGTGEPEGIVTGATYGAVAASASAITYAEILNLIHSVDPVYRNGAQLMFHDQTLRAIKGLVDEQNRPLFLAGYADREPDTINGYRYIINNNMPTMAMNARSIIFGDLKSFWVRNVKGFGIQRLDEVYAHQNAKGFISFAYYDSRVINAGTGPIRFLSHITSS